MIINQGDGAHNIKMKGYFIMNELTNVTTGEARLSYVHLFKPYAYQPGQEEKDVYKRQTEGFAMHLDRLIREEMAAKGKDGIMFLCICLLYTSRCV